ncbi:MAG: hypothetical protein ACI93N_000926 [Flavobacteriaceae bacterium]|jgi:hypothetical protein
MNIELRLPRYPITIWTPREDGSFCGLCERSEAIS